MASAVGTVTFISGLVYAIKSDGSERLLALGDEVFADELIRTSPDASVEIYMANGQEVVLGGGQSWLISAETYTEAADYPVEDAVADEDLAAVDAIQQAILAGEDPTQVAEETAAGAPGAGGQGDDGVRFEILTRTALEEDPEAGYETIGVERETNDIIREPGGEVSSESAAIPQLSVNDVTVNEDLGALAFTVSINVAADSDVVFTYTTNNNASAVDGADYTPVSGTAVIPAGETSVVISVPITDDNLAEQPETFLLDITDITSGNAEIADGEGVGTILDEPTPGVEDTVTLSITGDTSVAEGDTASYTVTIDEAPVEDLVVDILYSFVSADSSDIVEGVTQVTIPAGSTQVSFSVDAVNDAYSEGVEDFTVSISNPTSGGFEAVVVDSAAATVTTSIVDANDPADLTTTTVTLESTPNVEEGGDITVTATVDNPPIDTPLVITLDNGEEIIIPVGETVGSITFPADDNVYADADTPVEFGVGSAVGGGYENLDTSDTAVTTVVDDNDPTTVTLESTPSVEEGGDITVTATVDNPPVDTPLVITLDNGEEITIPVGETTGSVTFPVADDVYADPDTPVEFSVDSTTGGGYESIDTTDTSTTTIVDDNDVTTVTLESTPSVEEGGDITVTATVDNPPVDTPLVITLDNGETITIPVGQTTGEVTFPADDDVYTDPDTPVEFSIDSTTGGGYEALDTTDTATTTVVDDNDTTTVTLDSTPSVEEGGDITVTATVDNAPEDTPLVITLNNGEEIIIPVGQTTGEVTFPAGDDVYTDADTPVEFSVDSTSGGNYENLDTTDTATTTVVDDSDVTTLTLAGDSTVAEGGEATYTLTLSNPAETEMVVDVITGHTTTDDGDLVPTTQQVTILAGASTATFTVDNNQDNLAEGNEDYTVAITGSTGGNFEDLSVDTTPVTTTIIDDEGTPSLTINDMSVDEDAGTMTFTVTLSTPSVDPVSVDYASADNTSANPATEGADYTGVSGTLTFAPGETTQTITVPITDDTLAEGSETFDMVLSNPSNAVIADGTGVGTITDEAAPGAEDTVLVSITGDTAVDEGEAPATYTVSVNEAPTQDMTVDISYSYTSAESGDIVEGTTQVTIAANTTEVSFSVDTVDDAYAEGDEDFIVSISNPSLGGFEAVAVNPAQSSVTTTISDEASPTAEDTATISISGDPSVVEGDAATYTVSVDRVPLTDIEVTVQTGHVTTDDGDYVPVSTTVTIAAGTTSVDFTVQTTDDNLAEGTESYTVSITDTTGGSFENTVVGVSQVSTIITDEAAPTDPDADTAIVSLTGPGTVVEGETTTNYTVEISQAPVDDVTVTFSYTTTDADGNDYVQVADVVIAAGTTSTTFSIDTIDDNIAEGDEDYTVSIDTISNGGLEDVRASETENSVTTTITEESVPTDPDADTAYISLFGPGTVIEGETTTDYTVSISQAPVDDVTVTFNYTTTDADGNDYVAVGSVTILAGETDATFTIDTVNDNIAEGDEDFTVSIDTITDGGLEDVRVSNNDSVTTTIEDNDTVEISINDAPTVDESAGTMTFTVTLSNPSDAPVTVDYASQDGTATAGLDYTAVTGTLTFAPGETTQTITVPVTDDYLAEGSETLDMVLSNPSNATIADGVGLGIIVDEASPSAEDTISVTLEGPATVAEGATATYTVTLSEAAVTDMIVDVVTGHIDTDNGDLVPVTQQVTIVAGQTTATLDVTNTDDAYVEGGEDYSVTLTGTTSGGGFEAVDVDTTPVITTINDNSPTDPSVEPDAETISVTLTGDSSVAEGGTATYTITLDQPTATEMTVEVIVGHITTDDGDLTPVTQSITIPAGSDSVEFTVDNTDDNLAEGNESYQVELSGTTTGGGFETISVDTTPVNTTIVDNDVLSISVDDVTVNESAGTLTFTVSLSVPTTDAVTFDYATSDDSALAGSDYTAVSGSGSIAAGDTQYTIEIPITDDNYAELTETFNITLSNVSAGVAIADGSGVGTITDDSAPADLETSTVTLESTPSVEEGGDITVTATVDNPPVDTPLVITLDNGETITIPVGQTTGEVTFPADDDVYTDPDTPVEFSIDSTTGGGYEALDTTDTATTTVVDDNDTTTVTLDSTPSVEEGGDITVTATVDNAPEDTPLVITLNNGEEIIIPVGQTTGEVTFPAGDDVYTDADTPVEFSVDSTSGGNYENLDTTDTATTTVVDDSDVTTLTLAGDSTVAEGGEATYTLTLSNPAETEMVVDVITGHTTTDDGDLVPTTQQVTILAGASTATFTVDNNQDNLAEGNEDYTVAITGSTGGNFEDLSVDTTPVTTTIIDDEGTPSLTINDMSVDEDAGTMTFTVTLSTPSVDPVSVDYASADNTSANPATEGADYTGVSGTLTFAPGETTQTITVPITDDTLAEGSETFDMVLSNPSNAVIADGTGVGTITDEAAPGAEDTVLVSITGDTAVDEGEAPATYTVSVNEAPTQDMTVDISYSYTSAESGDIVEGTTQVTIAANTTEVSFSVDTVDDAYAEGDEDFIVSISNPSLGGFEAVAVNPAQSSVTTTISDEASPTAEDTATISISGDPSVVEGDAATYTVSVDRVPLTDIEVTVQTGHVTTDDGDYVPVSTTVTIAAGTTSVDFTVQTTDDNLAEGTESYTVSITDTTGGSFENTVVGVSQVSTIITDEAAPTDPDADTAIVSLTGPGTVVEGETTTNYTVEISQAPVDDVTVTFSYTTTDADGNDYVQVADVVIAAGTTSTTFSIDTIDDNIAEGDEDYTVSIDTISNGGLEDVRASETENSVTTTITEESVPTDPDADTAYISLFGPGTVIEGETTTDYTVSISQAPVDDVTVTFNYTTTDADGNDYVAVGSVTILAGETDATFTIDTVNDNIAEGDEDFTVSIDTITDGGLEDVRVSNNDSVTTTIEDNDTVEISINDAPTVDESAGTMTFTVTLSNPSDAPVTVDYASQDGTATAGLDYTAVTGTLTFAPGETTQTITVPVTDDYLAEGSETLDMVLSNPSNATIADGVGLGIIVDEASPTNEDTVYAVISVDQASVSEGQSLTYTVSLVDINYNAVSVPAGNDVTVGINWTGAAASGVDTSTLPASVVITGNSSISFVIDASFDDVVEGDEPLVATITSVIDNDSSFEATAVGTNDVANSVIVDGTPDAVDDTITTDEDTPVIIPVLGNDTDPEGSALTVTGASTPANGTVTINADGTITYTPNANFNGADTFTYTITDEDGNQDTATVTVNITPVNDAPVVAGGQVSGEEDTPLTLSWDDFGISDIDNTESELSVRITSLPEDGTLEFFNGLDWASVVTGDAISYADITAGSLRFNPDTHESGDDSFGSTGTGDQLDNYADFTFEAFDTDGGVAAGTLEIDITPVVDEPTLTLGSETVGDRAIDDDNFVLPQGNGLILRTYTNVENLDSNSAANADLLEDALNADVPDTETVVMELGTGTDAEGAVDVPTDGAVSLTGLIYLQADHTYSFTGYVDDTMQIEVGGDVVYSQGFNTWGTYNTNDFTPAESGYYTFELYSYNGDAVGDISALISVDGAPAESLSTQTIFTDIGSVDDAGGQYSSYIDNNNDGGYYPVRLNEGIEDTPIQIQDINAALIDTDGSEILGISISAIPEGAVLSDGTHTFTSSAGSTEIDVTDWDLTRVTITAPENFNGTFDIDVNATSTERSTGDSVTTTLPISIVVAAINDGPTIIDSTANVSEEGLVEGLADSNAAAGYVDTTDSASVTGTVLAVDPEGDAITTFTLIEPSNSITSGGYEVTWSGSGTQSLTGYANGEAVATLSIDDSGNYQFDLLESLDHADPNGEDSLDINFGVVSSDGDATDTGVLRIVVEDDSPDEVSPQSDELAMVDTNLMIVLDVSGSMDQSSGIGDQNRLESAIDSIITLLQRYDEFGDVSVRLVTFSTTANAYGNAWEDVDTAIAQLEAIRAAGAAGGTNYDEALGDAITAFESDGKITDAQNLSYFFSDGLPTFGAGNGSSLTGNTNGSGYNQNGNDTGISAAEESIWTNFLNSNQVKSFAIGIGEGISDVSYLDPIAYDGQSSANIGGTIVSSFDDLDDVLDGTVINPVGGQLVKGVLLIDSVGADGGYVKSIIIDGVTYTLDYNANTISVSGGANNSTYDASNFILTVSTTAGGQFVVDLDGGEYNYTAPDSIDESIVERMDFALTDMDGDVSASYVEVDVERMNVLIGTTGSETLNGSNEGPDLIIGRDGNDIIFGNSGDDRLKGGRGADEIHGGEGDDRITGGPGADILSGDAGDDVFIWSAPSGADTITDFAVYQNSGDERDVLDLSDLLQGETTDTWISICTLLSQVQIPLYILNQTAGSTQMAQMPTKLLPCKAQLI